MIELIAFVAVVAVVLVLGTGLGMLAAPRLFRWTERDDEDPRDDGPG